MSETGSSEPLVRYLYKFNDNPTSCLFAHLIFIKHFKKYCNWCLYNFGHFSLQEMWLFMVVVWMLSVVYRHYLPLVCQVTGYI